MNQTFDAVERTQHYYRTVDAADVDGVLDWFAEDATYWRPGYPPMRGREALAEFYGGERVIEDGTHTIDDIVAEGSSVAARGRFEGRLKDGSQVQLGFADFITYDASGRAVERRTYFEAPAV